MLFTTTLVIIHSRVIYLAVSKETFLVLIFWKATIPLAECMLKVGFNQRPPDLQFNASELLIPICKAFSEIVPANQFWSKLYEPTCNFPKTIRHQVERRPKPEIQLETSRSSAQPYPNWAIYAAIYYIVLSNSYLFMLDQLQINICAPLANNTISLNPTSSWNWFLKKFSTRHGQAEWMPNPTFDLRTSTSSVSHFPDWWLYEFGFPLYGFSSSGFFMSDNFQHHLVNTRLHYTLFFKKDNFLKPLLERHQARLLLKPEMALKTFRLPVSVTFRSSVWHFPNWALLADRHRMWSLIFLKFQPFQVPIRVTLLHL